jgi:hypothetical protein
MSDEFTGGGICGLRPEVVDNKGMGKGATLLLLLVLYGCGKPVEETPRTMEEAVRRYPALKGENASVTVRNDSDEKVGLKPLMWGSGCDLAAGDPVELKPGEELKLAPFAKARGWMAMNQPRHMVYFLEPAVPTSDYGIGLYEVDSSGTGKLIAFKRLSYEDLLASDSRPISILFKGKALEVYKGDQKEVRKL